MSITAVDYFLLEGIGNCSDGGTCYLGIKRFSVGLGLSGGKHPIAGLEYFKGVGES